jgi:hypothetical protein
MEVALVSYIPTQAIAAPLLLLPARGEKAGMRGSCLPGASTCPSHRLVTCKAGEGIASQIGSDLGLTCDTPNSDAAPRPLNGWVRPRSDPKTYCRASPREPLRITGPSGDAFDDTCRSVARYSRTARTCSSGPCHDTASARGNDSRAGSRSERRAMSLSRPPRHRVSAASRCHSSHRQQNAANNRSDRVVDCHETSSASVPPA